MGIFQWPMKKGEDDMTAIESKYVIWDYDVVKKCCTVEKIVNLTDDDYQLREDTVLGEAFTRAASFQLADVDPKGPVLPDNLINTDMALIVSPRLKDFLNAKQLSDVEYLPFGLVDAKDKKIPGTLFYVHVLNNPDCLDREKCDVTRYSGSDKDRIDRMNHIVFKSNPKRDLFRAKGYRREFFVSRSLAEAIHQAGFTGVRFWEIKGYLEKEEDDDGESSKKIAFESFKEMPPAAGAGRAGKPHYQKPAKECQDWIETIEKQFQQSQDSSSNFKVGGQSFVPAWGEEEWLDSYEEDDSPAFDPKRYHAIGFNGGSDYWLLDLESGAVVFFAHDRAYDETNCEVVTKDWLSFAKQVTKR